MAPPSTSAADARSRAAALALVAALSTLAGCADREKARADSAAIAATLAPPPGAPPASDCPKDGRWRTCSITKRLTDAGLIPHQLPDTTRVPFLTPAGASWTVSKVDLRVFLYDSVAQADREAQALDPIRVAPRGGSYAWPAPATLVHSGNLIAVLLSENARQVERVQLALEAGPPQPEGPAVAQPLPPSASH
ncbi:hypothetical protein [Roseisolibacter agri]|uniref:Uncharacterized protein n=1 Tax=Roseisolibacter agri TaxID=2014610 RepID=A0AA37Q9H8_9BACT|nr:hypothetical protein [Roseisolibacter agri]GLC25561.1 hypothetical protein rosag_20740 [Roseisolibacter agri]